MKTIHLKIIFIIIVIIIAGFVAMGIFDPSVSTSLEQKEIKNPLVK